MGKRESVTVRARRRYRVDLSRVRFVERPAALTRPYDTTAPARARQPFGRVAVRLYDGGSRITTAARYSTGDPNDLVNRFVANHYETGPFPSIAETAAVADQLAAQADRPSPALTYEHSGRPFYGQTVPLGANDETDGVAMAVGFERRERLASDPQAKRVFGVASYAPWCHRMRTPVEQLAAYDETADSYIGTEHEPGWRATRRQIERLQLESFDAATWPRAQSDMTIAPPLLPGLWCPSFTGGLLYQPFDPLDRTNYHATDTRSSAGRESLPWASCGESTSTTVHVQCQPKRPRIMFRWVAVYLNITLFAPPIISVETNLGAFTDRLPMGFAYREEPEQSINDTAMSGWIRETNRYALGLRQDLGSQVFSLYYIKLLVMRVDGLWQYFRAGARVGDLAGVLDVERGRDARSSTQYRVYRRTAIAPGTTAEGYGSLHVPGEVTGHNKIGPTFEGGAEYGPF